jgi:hypothetical protein
MRVRQLLVLLVLTTLTAGCGTQRGPDSTTPSAIETPALLRAGERDAVEALTPGAAGDPSEFQWEDQIFHFLTKDGRVIDEQPWTACLGNGCWDGAPGLGGQIASVGSPDALYFAFDYPGWKFHWVSFNPIDDECGGRSITVRATAVTDRIFRVDPAGLRGEWRVDVFGRAPAGGDAVTSVRWTTPDDGSMPEPGATGSLFTDQDGKRVALYGGPELHLADLARTPARAAAWWTVTDRDGNSVTLPLRREESRCERDGAVSFQGRELTPAELDSLSGEWVTYTVELSLDGKTYTGTAQWPQDETAEAPYTRFTFDPPLPAYRG